MGDFAGVPEACFALDFLVERVAPGGQWIKGSAQKRKHMWLRRGVSKTPQNLGVGGIDKRKMANEPLELVLGDDKNPEVLPLSGITRLFLGIIFYAMFLRFVVFSIP
jgi:hypothetical protein